MHMSNFVPKSANQRPSLFINRRFALLWGGQAISQIGDFVFGTTIILWIATVLAKGQPWAPLAISGDLLALSIPMFTIGPFAGVFVDRWNKRKMMLWMDALRAGFILLLFLTDVLALLVPGARLPIPWQLGAIYAAIFLSSACSLFFNPARFALLSDIVSEEERPRATGLTQLSVNTAVIIGPLIATALFFSVGLEWALLLNALSFVVSFGSIALIRLTGMSMGMMPRPQGTVLGEFGQGIKFFVQNRLLRVLLITNVFFMIGGGALGALNIFFVTRNLHTAPNFFGVLETAAGIGAIVGATIAIAFAQRVGVTRMFWLSLLTIGLLITVYARLDSLVPALVVTFLLGVPDAVFLASNGPIMMHATPPQFMGRTMSVFMPITSLATIVSTALIGYLASTVISGFHATALGMAFGPIDTIFTATGLIIIGSGLYALINLRGVVVSKRAMRPGPIIVQRPRDGKEVPAGAGPVVIGRPYDGMPGGPEPVPVERPRDGRGQGERNGMPLPGGPVPMMVERPRDGMPGPVMMVRPDAEVAGHPTRVPFVPGAKMPFEMSQADVRPRTNTLDTPDTPDTLDMQER